MYPKLLRDAEYKRLGTLSLLAGIDLLTGIAIPLVSESHKSSDFINLLKKFDAMYPEGDVIRVICDNHSAHKVNDALKTRPLSIYSYENKLVQEAHLLDPGLCSNTT